MRSIAVFSHADHSNSRLPTTETVEIDGIKVAFGLVCQDELPFDRGDEENAHNVLVRIKAFSCNFRDKALIFLVAQRKPAGSYYVLGSDFVGEVVGVGSAVSGLRVGDRVIGDGHWSGFGAAVPNGLPTNHGSKEYQLFHYKKLVKIPENMSTEVAAAFGIGAQTAYSMVRKLDLSAGANVLVTAAKSNTSLFAINALRKYNVNVYATTTSMKFEERLRSLGVKKLLKINPQEGNFVSLRELTAEVGKVDVVIDPFFDLHLAGILPSLKNGGRYITCGLQDQYSQLIGGESGSQKLNFKDIMTHVLVQNIQIIGNCLGVTQDLKDALQDYASGNFNVTLDSVFTNGDVGSFFTRTYNSKERFGKVVYRYE